MANHEMGATLLTENVAAISGLKPAIKNQKPIERAVYLIKLKNRSLGRSAQACNDWLIEGNSGDNK